jgi:hypothetical protein
MTTVVPLDEAIAALDTTEAVADRKRRAKEMAKKLVGDERSQMISSASRDEIEKAQVPIRRAANSLLPMTSDGPGQSVRDAERGVGRNYDEICVRQCEIHLRRMDELAERNDLDRQEESRLWVEYTTQVGFVAQRQGNYEGAFIAKWKDLISARADALEFGDSTAAIERRLERLTGVPYPVLPDAAWASADLMSPALRQGEYDRLTNKYGERSPSTDTRTGRRGRK